MCLRLMNSFLIWLMPDNVSGPESFFAPTCNSVRNQSQSDLPPDQLKALYEVLPSWLIRGPAVGNVLNLEMFLCCWLLFFFSL